MASGVWWWVSVMPNADAPDPVSGTTKAPHRSTRPMHTQYARMVVAPVTTVTFAARRTTAADVAAAVAAAEATLPTIGGFNLGMGREGADGGNKTTHPWTLPRARAPQTARAQTRALQYAYVYTRRQEQMLVCWR